MDERTNGIEIFRKSKRFWYIARAIKKHFTSKYFPREIYENEKNENPNRENKFFNRLHCTDAALAICVNNVQIVIWFCFHRWRVKINV